jgi:hypothetical protein
METLGEVRGAGARISDEGAELRVCFWTPPASWLAGAAAAIALALVKRRCLGGHQQRWASAH